MKTFADLKRTIQAGTRIHVVLHEYRPELTSTMRTVTRTQTNGFYYKSDGKAI